jgi:hypothetical protein
MARLRKLPANLPPEPEDRTEPTEDIVIELPADDLGEVTLDLAVSPAEQTPDPLPRPSDDEAVKKAVEAQTRAEELARTAQRERDDAIRQTRDREEELARERGDREDAQFNSVLTAIAAEQSTIDKAEGDYAAAAQAGDWAAASKAQREMAIASARLDRLEDNKRAFETKRETKPAPAPERTQPSSHDPVEQRIIAMSIPDTAKSWLRGHQDYLTDPRKNARLQAAHYEALDDAGGDSQMGTQKYLDALETRLGLRQAPTQTDPAPTQRRSMPLSAPVSRDVPSASGVRQESNQMRLNAEERKIARDSFSAIKDASGKLVDLTNTEKEYLYAQNKARLHRMRANGEYRHTTEQTG